ncbi:hypothetical protein F5Y16DRAFT_16930 [Xylariaceae sp. FL0255]|nr:hypothetical protein F5Y16DRAFT_16930 [Xylariaceae sp. FL0255]
MAKLCDSEYCPRCQDRFTISDVNYAFTAYMEKGGCVLVGDAVHASQPSSGQGASMPFEDSETLALLFENYLKEDPDTGHFTAVKKYCDIRPPPLTMVFKQAQQLAGMKQDTGFFHEMVMYAFI